MLLAFGIPTLVAALSMQPPVDVETLSIAAPMQALHLGRDIGPTVTGDDELHVRFTNDGDQPIKRIVFVLKNGRRVADAGTFAPGVTIDQTLDIGRDTAESDSDDSVTLADGDTAESGSVNSVTFADGTQWRAPMDVPSGTFETPGPSAEGGG